MSLFGHEEQGQEKPQASGGPVTALSWRALLLASRGPKKALSDHTRMRRRGAVRYPDRPLEKTYFV